MFKFEKIVKLICKVILITTIFYTSCTHIEETKNIKLYELDALHCNKKYKYDRVKFTLSLYPNRLEDISSTQILQFLNEAPDNCFNEDIPNLLLLEFIKQNTKYSVSKEIASWFLKPKNWEIRSSLGNVSEDIFTILIKDIDLNIDSNILKQLSSMKLLSYSDMGVYKLNTLIERMGRKDFAKISVDILEFFEGSPKETFDTLIKIIDPAFYLGYGDNNDLLDLYQMPPNKLNIFLKKFKTYNYDVNKFIQIGLNKHSDKFIDKLNSISMQEFENVLTNYSIEQLSNLKRGELYIFLNEINSEASDSESDDIISKLEYLKIKNIENKYESESESDSPKLGNNPQKKQKK